jgi:hypothetical protein
MVEDVDLDYLGVDAATVHLKTIISPDAVIEVVQAYMANREEGDGASEHVLHDHSLESEGIMHSTALYRH